MRTIASTNARVARLLIDRFAWLPAEGWIDLATDRPVTLVESRRADVSLTAWLERCARLVGIWHSHLVPLIDYGIAPDRRRVEVYPRFLPREPVRLREAAAAATRASPAPLWRAVGAFLHARALRLGALDDGQVVRLNDRVMVLPGDVLGDDAHEAPQALDAERAALARIGPAGRPTSTLSTIGLALIQRPVLDAVVAVLERSQATGPSALWLNASARGGLSTLLAAVAREARRDGMVPVCPASLQRVDVRPLLRDRTVTLLVDRSRSADDVASALACAMRHTGDVRAIVGCLASRDGEADVGRVDCGELARRTVTWPPTDVARLGALAQASDGLPGRFVDAWLTGAVRDDTGRTTAARRGAAPSRVAVLASWTSDSAAASCRVAERAAAWNAPVEPTQAIVRVAASTDVTARASALPRSARTMLDEGWRALGDARLREAVERFTRLTDVEVSVEARLRAEAMWGLGVCALEAARLDDSERWLRASACLADPLSDDHRLRRGVAYALTRCLLWQGRDADASRVFGAAAAADEDCPSLRLRARLARHAGHPGDALAALGRAVSVAEGESARAAVACDLARLLCHAGDRAAAAMHLRAAMRSARRARSRARWLRVRLLGLEMAAVSRQMAPERGGGARVARPEAGRLARVARRLLGRDVPPLVRLRAARALEALGWRRTREVDAFVGRWGERALWPASGGGTAMMNHLQAVLEICRDADEPRQALDRVRHCVRERLSAGTVAIHAAPGTLGRVALAGSPRLQTAPLALRLLDSGVRSSLAPGEAGVEAGAPVTYAGRTIGAVVCRWAVDPPVDASDADALLVTAATALAPHLQGLLDGDARPAGPVDDGLGLLGGSATIAALRERIHRAALAPFHVLIEGESGSGKEVAARAIHATGPRRRRRFCALNCAAITDDLIEAELFGHSRGAFTGAVSERPGLFEDADGGTLFLDEVGELSPRAQAKLLRVIQEGEVRRVGENVARRVDARIVAATNRRLREEVEAGRFRADLLYRLDVIRVTVPALRERPEDIPLLARTFWREATLRLGSRATLHPDTVAALARYHWPGNVRELQNVVMALAVNAPPRGPVAASRLPAAIAAQAETRAALSLDAARRSFEERFVRSALARAGNRPGRAAHDLGLTRQGLRKLLVRLRIEISANGIDASALDTLTADAPERRP